jgi:hypothetical protein
MFYQTALVLAWGHVVVRKRSWSWQGDGIRGVVPILRPKARDFHHCMSFHELRGESVKIIIRGGGAGF